MIYFCAFILMKKKKSGPFLILTLMVVVLIDICKFHERLPIRY